MAIEKKLNHINSVDRVQKLLADIYNDFDTIISYEKVNISETINNKQKKYVKYINFNICDNVTNYHKKFKETIYNDYKFTCK